VEQRTPDSVYNAMQTGSLLATLDYTGVKPPTLSLYSDTSAVPDPEGPYFRDFIALIKKSGPQVQTEIINGSCHYLFIDHPDEVAAKMNAFLGVN
jgi:pimeloyl-ACP methyl ester carboxylesterase